ncbi:C40 family peptidase [Alcanivorax marinus]|nr:NlpC/P60 family protein [Alloalcanivorax marinus]MBM7335071.1 C40 family peptidase [Alloalcanivorax marinus]
MGEGPRVEERGAGAEPPPLLRDDVPAADLAPISPLLRAQAEQWRGVPYRLGGNDRQGIDCSAFVQVTFQSRLGIQVPRTTDELARQGRRVGRDELRAGDLVFFKTGFRQRHVGIYMGGDRFLHASTSRGVMTSSLNNVYWRRHYWKARRLDLDERPSAVSLSDESR